MSGELFETQLATRWLPCGLGNRKDKETERGSGGGRMISWLRTFLVGVTVGSGDSVVLGASKPLAFGHSLSAVRSDGCSSWFVFLPVRLAKLP